MKSFLILFTLLTIVIIQSGCASVAQGWKNLISGGAAPQPKTATASQATFSKQQNLLPGAHRDYRRTTRKTLEDSAQLEAKSGSLWVMEGQGAYLFSQNVVRMIGDPLGVRIEGDPLDQLKQKSNVISDLLKQLEERRMRALALAKAQNNPQKQAKAEAAAAAAPAAEANRDPAAEKSAFSVKSVPTRVVERLVDGNYRVRGTQPFMIGNREYKVIVSGVVRAEDFNEEGIGADQLLDSHFDIVSSRTTEVR